MVIKEKIVEVRVSGNNMYYYERLGYKINRSINKYGKITVPSGSKILVKVEDLMSNSTVKLTKICDLCGREITPKIAYGLIIAHRKKSGGQDTCRPCGTKKKHENYIKNNKCLIDTHPHLADSLVNKDDAYNYTPYSSKELAFKCTECSHVFSKEIQLVTKTHSALFCPRCSDGIKYPEKFVRSLLLQLGEEFEHQKMFKEWFKRGDKKVIKKFYDFYLKNLKCIIEVHGEQHYFEGFQGTGGRSLEEEQENDRLKKYEALNNGICESNYIVIDARISSLAFLKESVLNSRLIQMFDLSIVDWNKCHKDALKTFVKIACDEWNKGMKSTKEISIKLGLGQSTVIKYLKQGAEISWCDYNAENEIYSRKAVVQLSLDGKLIREFNSISEASYELGASTTSSISSVCGGEGRTAYGFRWKYKEDYENLSEEEKGNLQIFEPALNEKKEVYQLDKELNIIYSYSSVTEASLRTGISISMISEVCNGKLNSAGGYKWLFKCEFDNLSEEQREKLCKISLVPITKKKIVYQLDVNFTILNVFESLEEAKRKTGIASSKISPVCKGKRKTAGGYKWMYKCDYENLKEEDRFQNNKSNSRQRQRYIYQLDEKLNLINSFKSFAEAKNQTGISSIWEVCNGKQKSAGGFIWMYKDDYDNLNGEERKQICNMEIPSVRRGVYQLNNSLDIIDSYKSVEEAKRKTGINNISSVCKGKRKTAGGYKWMYIDD